MTEKYASPRILFPRSIPEALELARAEPEAIYWAGGTRIASDSQDTDSRLGLPKVVIALGLVEELARASRSEHNLEIGSMMSLDRLASVGKSALPAGLSEALSLVGTLPLRCRATIGGHLAWKEGLGDLVPLLSLLETHLEIRSLRERKGRRKPVTLVRRPSLAQFLEGGGLERGELISRISIPMDHWNLAMVQRIPPVGERKGHFTFAALARTGKGVIEEWRMALSDGQGPVLRNQEMEAGMAGGLLPFSDRVYEKLDEGISEMTTPWAGRVFDRETALCLARGFLREVGG